jgi:inner membrane transporter RhtA
MFAGALSNQLGAATGALAFGVIGPAGVVAVRQWIAAIVLLAAGRPRWRAFSWAQWRPVLLLAAVYGTMNLSLYSAIGRLGLGLAVTLEFLGPLAVALATSRRRADLVCALVAGAGVVALTRPRPATDYLGIGLAYWRLRAGRATSSSTGRSGAGSPAHRGRPRPPACPRCSSCRPGSWS